MIDRETTDMGYPRMSSEDEYVMFKLPEEKKELHIQEIIKQFMDFDTFDKSEKAFYTGKNVTTFDEINIVPGKIYFPNKQLYHASNPYGCYSETCKQVMKVTKVFCKAGDEIYPNGMVYRYEPIKVEPEFEALLTNHKTKEMGESMFNGLHNFYKWIYATNKRQTFDGSISELLLRSVKLYDRYIANLKTTIFDFYKYFQYLEVSIKQQHEAEAEEKRRREQRWAAEAEISRRSQNRGRWLSPGITFSSCNWGDFNW